jgi:hypothetical protein
MEPRISSQYSGEPATWIYSEPVERGPQTHILLYPRLKILGLQTFSSVGVHAPNILIQFIIFSQFSILGVRWDWAPWDLDRKLYIVPAPDDMREMEHSYNENWKEKPKYWKKTYPTVNFPPQTPHELTRGWSWAAEVRSRRLTASAAGRPISLTISTWILQIVIYSMEGNTKMYVIFSAHLYDSVGLIKFGLRLCRR